VLAFTVILPGVVPDVDGTCSQLPPAGVVMLELAVKFSTVLLLTSASV
jgi:hypothetical protein